MDDAYEHPRVAFSPFNRLQLLPQLPHILRKGHHWKSGTTIPPQAKINHALKIKITNWNDKLWTENSGRPISPRTNPPVSRCSNLFGHCLLCHTEVLIMSIFIIFSNIFVIVQIFYNIFIQISFLSLNISKLFMVKVKRGTILSAMSHRSLELIASPSMATAFVIPSSVPSPMSPATPNVTSSFATSFAKSDYALRKFVHNKFKSEREANYRNSLFQKYFLFYLIFIFFYRFSPQNLCLIDKKRGFRIIPNYTFCQQLFIPFFAKLARPSIPNKYLRTISLNISFILLYNGNHSDLSQKHPSPCLSILLLIVANLPNPKFQIPNPTSLLLPNFPNPGNDGQPLSYLIPGGTPD